LGEVHIINANITAPHKNDLTNLSIDCTARGLGRSYGDSALSKQVIESKTFAHFISFDEKESILHCEASVTLDDIFKVFVTKGWFLSVTPGTKFVTVGGAIASDVHGKNHHIDGSFSDHVVSFTLSQKNFLLTCSREENSDLFYATFGVMGLTGVITEATFKLLPIKSAYINQKTVKTKNLEATLKQFDKYEDYTYSIAWIDCQRVTTLVDPFL
jgi:decaprenylphospho-beta-D-ribofuranose 2-oxidase